jgi:hypothetical protein
MLFPFTRFAMKYALFMCNHDAGGSQMAAALARHLSHFDLADHVLDLPEELLT